MTRELQSKLKKLEEAALKLKLNPIDKSAVTESIDIMKANLHSKARYDKASGPTID